MDSRTTPVFVRRSTELAVTASIVPMTPAMLGAGLTCALATTVPTAATNDDTSIRCLARRFAKSRLSERTMIVSAMCPFLPDTPIDDRSVHRPDNFVLGQIDRSFPRDAGRDGRGRPQCAFCYDHVPL